MPSPQLRRPTCQNDWEDEYWHIRRAWWDQGKTLNEVMEMMKEEHGFDATAKQYKTMLDNWGLGKNVKTEEMKAIVKIQARRLPKETAFYVHNRPVPQNKIDRFLKRTYGVTRPSPSVFSPIHSTPWHIWYCTPLNSCPSDNRDGGTRQAQICEVDTETETWFEDFITLPSSSSSSSPPGANLSNPLAHSNPPAIEQPGSPSINDPLQLVADVCPRLSIATRDFCWGLMHSFQWAVVNNMNDLADDILTHQIPLSDGLLNGLLTGEVVSLIHIATIRRDVEGLQFLLEHGADPDTRTSSGYVAMHFAALFGDLAILDSLLEKGANTSVRRFRGSAQRLCPGDLAETPLMVAVTHGQPSAVIQFLLDRCLGQVDLEWVYYLSWTCISQCRCIECQLRDAIHANPLIWAGGSSIDAPPRSNPGGILLVIDAVSASFWASQKAASSLSSGEQRARNGMAHKLGQRL